MCICTVGTGTAGRYSNLAQGIVHAMLQRRPGRCCLTPSRHSESETLADLVTEALEAQGLPCCRHGAFSDPDDLLGCRNEMRRIIREVRTRYPEVNIVLNPTSGTKQMTAGAVLAAVDEGVDAVEFISGERADGVVKTGTERVVRVDPRRIIARQTARNALSLVEHGAYRGAERILEPYADLFPRFLALARALGFWGRFAYRRALRAVPPGDAFANLRKTLNDLANAPLLSLERAADMAAFADRALLEAGEPEEALAVLYRLAELLGKVRLHELGVDVEHPTPGNIDQVLRPPKPLFDKISGLLRADSIPFLGVATLYELLGAAGEPLPDRIRGDSLTWQLLQQRHETRYGHGVRFVDPAHVRELHSRIVRAATGQWPHFPDLVQKFRFPNIHPLIQEELDHV
ncbi:MAG: hypothetical protein GXP31_03620 [Kiritimatiellaeota bacterium]|nr:hypothetical protein [Kiritimatiellota bacterium]